MTRAPSQTKGHPHALPYIGAVGAALAFALTASPIRAQQPQQPPPCGPRAGIIAMLAEQYGETLQSMGIAEGGGAVFETYASESTGTWTILRSRVDGVSCMVGSGGGWDGAPETEPSGTPL